MYKSHPGLYNSICGGDESLLSGPVIDRLEPTRTISHPIDTVHESEDRIKGNLAILENILLGQCGLNRQKNRAVWEEGLRLIYGDQKTWARLWSIKKRGAEQEAPGYGQMKWLLPVPSLFHTRMCWLKVLHRTFWTGVQVPDPTVQNTEQSSSTKGRGRPSKGQTAPKTYNESPAYLKSAKDLWGRKRISHEKNNEFYALEEFIIHNFDSRITAAFWRCLFSKDPEDRSDGSERPNYSTAGQPNTEGAVDTTPDGSNTPTNGIPKSWTDKELDDEVAKRLENLKAKEFEQIVERIRRDVICRQPAKEEDPEYRNHMQFIQSVEPYLIMKHGIKYGDIGYISTALARMCFYFNGSSSHNYAQLMLWWAHHTASDAADEELQKAILANSLINTTGRKDGWKEIDIYNEHLNGEIKETWNARNNSSFNFGYALQYASLHAPTFQEIRQNLLRFYGITKSGRHVSKPAENDIRLYAHYIRKESFQQIKETGDDTTSRQGIRPATDLFQEGSGKAMVEKIAKYNQALPDEIDVEGVVQALIDEDEGDTIGVQLDGPVVDEELLRRDSDDEQ